MKSFFLLIFLLNFLSQNIYGQNNDTINLEMNIPEIQVSRTKDHNVRKMMPISVIYLNQGLLNGNTNVSELLSEQSGINLTPTVTGTQGVQIQGLEASYSSILIDGFPLIGASFGIIDLKRITLSNVDRIEILKGSSSSMYGSSALSGTINIITNRNSNKGTYFDFGINQSSNFTINPNASFSYNNRFIEINTLVDFFQTDGFDLVRSDLLKTVNPYKSFTSHTKFRFKFSNRFLLNSIARYYYKNQVNTSLFNNEVLEGESQANELNLGFSFNYYINSQINNEIEFYGTRYLADEFLFNSDNETYFESTFFNQNMNRFESRTFYTSDNFKFLLGLGNRLDYLDRTSFQEIASQNLQYTYTQITTRLRNKFGIIYGSRLDCYQNYDPKITSKLSCSIDINPYLTFNTTYSGGFKIPDFRQQFFDFKNSTLGYSVFGRDVVLDKIQSMIDNGMIIQEDINMSVLSGNLEPETSRNLNVGVFFKNTKLDLTLNIFKNNLANLIDYQQIGVTTNSTPIFTYFNLNKVKTYGLEINSKYIFNSKLLFSAGYQLLYAYDVDVLEKFQTETVYANDIETNESFILNGNDYFGLFNRSRHMMNFNTVYLINNKWKTNVMSKYRTKYALNDVNGNNVLDQYDIFIKGYLLCDIGISFKHSKNLLFSFGINNIFDYTNPEFITYLSGRNYFINLNISLSNQLKK